MTNVKIGIQTCSLRQPLKQAIETAARLGAEGIEVDARTELLPAQMSQTAIRQFRKLLGDLNLRVSAVSFITRRGYDVPDDLERRVLATQAAMKMAQAIGAGVVINRIGHAASNSIAGASFASGQRSRLIDALTALGAYGDRVGARLAAQTGSESGEHLAELLADVPSQTVGVDLHPSGLIFNGHDPQAAVAALGTRIIHVHACDAVRDLSRGQAFAVELGRGSADLPGLLGRLTEFDYGGWVTIEQRDSTDPISEIANAVAYLQSL
ncbi:MAG TPA: sugar phosphate isomerase/epimerase family protein [Lacipirellulaceae bacterium]